jgi:hypothetical protein
MTRSRWKLYFSRAHPHARALSLFLSLSLCSLGNPICSLALEQYQDQRKKENKMKNSKKVTCRSQARNELGRRGPSKLSW